MTPDFIRKVFRRDYAGLLGFDIYELLDDMSMIHSTGFKQFPDLFKASFESLADVTARLLRDYLDYNPEKFSDPMAQYMSIYEHRDEILDLVDELKVSSPKDDPALYMMWAGMKASVTRLLDTLVSCGSSHKFDEEMLTNTYEFNEPIIQ